MKHPAVPKLLFCAASVLCGWIAAFAMSPVSFWPCLFIGLSGLYYLYSKTITGPQAFAAGFFFALGYFVTGLWWIGNALLVEGNDFAWVWPISVIGLPTLLALFTGTYLAIARMMSDPKTLRGFFAFAFFLTFSEWARGHAFTGFPWNLYGYAWADYLPMAQSAHFIGAYGLTFISVLWAASPEFMRAHAMIRTKLIILMTLVTTMAAFYAMGAVRLKYHPTEYDQKNGVAVVQPNIPQNVKWDPVAVQDNFNKTLNLSNDGGFAEPSPENLFVVWPETAISPAIYSVDTNMQAISRTLGSYKNMNAYLITGILRREKGEDGETHFANSLVMFNKSLSALKVYDKHHLVPFGEFIPLQNLIPLKPVAAFRGFDRGDGPATVAHSGTPPFSPLICYEVIFPDDVIAKHTAPPVWIVNVTNDGWYGDSAGPHQHFAQTRLRAIEEGLPVIRAANTGISGIIDSYGRVIDKADIFQEATLVSYLPKPLHHPNPYWPWILQPILPIVAISLMLAAFRPRRK